MLDHRSPRRTIARLPQRRSRACACDFAGVTAVDIAAWLRRLGLERYEQAFRGQRRSTVEVLSEAHRSRPRSELGVTRPADRREAASRQSPALAEPDQAKAKSHGPAARSRRPRRRTAAADGDVVRAGRLDGFLGKLGPRGSASRSSGSFQEVLHGRGHTLAWARGQATGVTACWRASAGRKRTRMTPRAPCAPG